MKKTTNPFAHDKRALELLKAEAKNGHSRAELARMFETTPYHVQRALDGELNRKERETTTPFANPKNLKRLRAMRKKGRTYADLAEHFGVSKWTIKRYLGEPNAVGRPLATAGNKLKGPQRIWGEVSATTRMELDQVSVESGVPLGQVVSTLVESHAGKVAGAYRRASKT